MMKEWIWWWRAGKVRKNLHLRLVVRLNRWENPLRRLAMWIRGGCSLHRFDLPVTGELSRSRGQCVCYCETGSTTEFSFNIFGNIKLWGWLSRDWTPRPCHCDKVVWLISPDIHWEEIEDYGLEKLRVEYPDLVQRISPEQPSGNPG